jgi:hypothetical protein
LPGVAAKRRASVGLLERGEDTAAYSSQSLEMPVVVPASAADPLEKAFMSRNLSAPQ